MTDIIRMTTNFVDSCMRGRCGADKYGNYTSSLRLFKRWIPGVGGGGVTPGKSWWGCAGRFSKS